MAEYTDREAFIPYRKADVVKLCIADGKLSDTDAKKFYEFCEIVGAYYHFDFHGSLEKLKDNFAPFDPDADTKPHVVPTAEQEKEMYGNLVEALSSVLEKGNYTKLSDAGLEKALNEESLITLNLDIDFDDFEHWVLYHRGDKQETVQLKSLFKKKELTMDIFERVVLLLKFKDEEYFLKKYKGKKKKVEALNFTPGKTYLYMYKNIPQADLEILFPNVEISMNTKDKLMLGVPAGAAAIPVLLKILPSLGVIGVLIVAFLQGKEAISSKKMMQGVIAALSGLAVLGGFVFKQYVKYKNKRIKFLKDVSDTLFFKSLVSNAGVFNTLVDGAEEEECKEMFLAYYHLLTSEEPLTQEELDDKIENWLEEKYDTKVDFDVEKALARMQSIVGKIVKDGEDEDSVPETPLLTKDADGKCKVLNIDDSKTVIDYVWDNFFQYNEA